AGRPRRDQRQCAARSRDRWNRRCARGIDCRFAGAKPGTIRSCLRRMLAAWRGGARIRTGTCRRRFDRYPAPGAAPFEGARFDLWDAEGPMTDRSSFLDGVYDFTLHNLRTLKARWRDFAGERSAISTLLSDGGADRLRRQMQDCLEARGGEVSARARAAALGQTYLAAPAEGRARFLRLLADEFDIDRVAVASACQRLAHAHTEDEKRRIERALRQALEPPRVKLLTQFNALPNGVKFLVDMRAELMKLARHDQSLAALDQDLRALLAGWFDEGFLEVKRITWDSPASLLEKLMVYEAVHEIRSWSDLKNRLEADRRCFAYFHPRMPEEPLIFVEVALVQGMADNIQSLLDETAPV